jgi:hypothetical protein
MHIDSILVLPLVDNIRALQDGDMGCLSHLSTHSVARSFESAPQHGARRGYHLLVCTFGVVSSTRRHRDWAGVDGHVVIVVRQEASPQAGSTWVMKASSPLSNISFATPMPPGCSTGANGFFTTYSTYKLAQI